MRAELLQSLEIIEAEIDDLEEEAILLQAEIDALPEEPSWLGFIANEAGSDVGLFYCGFNLRFRSDWMTTFVVVWLQDVALQQPLTSLLPYINLLVKAIATHVEWLSLF